MPPDDLAATIGMGAAECLLCPLPRAFSILGWGWGVSVGPSMWLQFSLDSGIPEILKERGHLFLRSEEMGSYPAKQISCLTSGE